jgi:putative tricarboxylic transport membrane protein
MEGIKGIMKIQYDRVGGVIWMALGTALGIGSIRLGLGTLHKPGSGFMPFLTGVLLGLMGLLLAFLHTRKPTEKKREEEVSLRPFWGKGACSLAASFLYAFVLDPLGFVVATFLLIFSLFKIMGSGKWIVPVLISFLTVVVSYFIFEVWLRINFPKGILRIG